MGWREPTYVIFRCSLPCLLRRGAYLGHRMGVRNTGRKFSSIAIALTLVLAVGFASYTLFFGVSEEPEPDAGDGEEFTRPVRADPVVKPKPIPLLTGRVIDADTRNPVADAEVHVSCDGASYRTLSRQDGGFSFSELPDGECEVSVRAPARVVAGPDPTGRHLLRIRSGRTLSDIELALHRSATVSGRVERRGQAVRGANISVLVIESSGADTQFVTSTQVETDAGGQFVVEDVAPGRIRILAEHQTYGLAESDDVFVRSGAMHDALLIQMSDVGDIVGQVLAPNQQPVENARIAVSRGSMMRVRKTPSDSDGKFLLSGIPEGAIRLTISAHGFQPHAPIELNVIANEAATLSATLTPRTGFGGRVLSPQGESVSGAAVYIRPTAQARDFDRRAVALTDEDGFFWVDSPPTSPAVAWARHSNWGPTLDTAIAGAENDLRLVLQAGGALTGRVVDEQGLPLSIYRIQLLGTVGSRHSRGRLVNVRDPDGIFRLEPVEPGRWAMVVTASNRPETHTRKWQVFANTDTDVGDIIIDHGGTIRGRVVDGTSGTAISGAYIGYEGVVGFRGRRRGVRSNAEGAFELPGIPSGTASVYVSAPKYVRRLISGVQVTGNRFTDTGDIALTTKDGKQGVQYSGIGISIAFREDRVVLQNVFDGGPAAAAELQRGTAIFRINGIDVGDLNPNQVVQMIRGEVGSEVALEVRRPGVDYIETIRVERQEVQAP